MTELAATAAGALAHARQLQRDGRLRYESLRPAPRSARRYSMTPGAHHRRIEFRHRHNRHSQRQRRHGNVGPILSPSNQNMLAGIKPTVGRVSRYGVIPITADQDTPGPMAKSVTDAAVMLGVLEGLAPDPNDPATSLCPRPPGQDYTPFIPAR